MNLIKGERGQSLIVLIFGLAFAGGMAILVVDVGFYLNERRNVQNASDFASLAGAQDLCDPPPLAVAAATDWADRNDVDVPGGELKKAEEVIFAGKDAIEVEVERTVDFYFAHFVGIPNAKVSSTATASAACEGSLRPFGLVEAAVAGLVPGANLTLQQKTGIGLGGNYWGLAIDGPGVGTWTATVQNGSDSALCAEDTLLMPVFEGNEGYEPPSASCPSDVATQGGIPEATAQSSVQWLFDNTSANCDSFNEVFDVVIPPLAYPTEIFEVKPQCDPNAPYEVEDSRRVITVPIIQDILLIGQTETTVVGFATLWLEDLNCPPLGLGSCTVTTVLVDLMGRTPWYRWSRLVE